MNLENLLREEVAEKIAGLFTQFYFVSYGDKKPLDQDKMEKIAKFVFKMLREKQEIREAVFGVDELVVNEGSQI
jgi:hypothetical protein